MRCAARYSMLMLRPSAPTHRCCSSLTSPLSQRLKNVLCQRKCSKSERYSRVRSLWNSPAIERCLHPLVAMELVAQTSHVDDMRMLLLDGDTDNANIGCAIFAQVQETLVPLAHSGHSLIQQEWLRITLWLLEAAETLGPTQEHNTALPAADVDRNVLTFLRLPLLTGSSSSSAVGPQRIIRGLHLIIQRFRNTADSGGTFSPEIVEAVAKLLRELVMVWSDKGIPQPAAYVPRCLTIQALSSVVSELCFPLHASGTQFLSSPLFFAAVRHLSVQLCESTGLLQVEIEVTSDERFRQILLCCAKAATLPNHTEPCVALVMQLPTNHSQSDLALRTILPLKSYLDTISQNNVNAAVALSFESVTALLTAAIEALKSQHSERRLLDHKPRVHQLRDTTEMLLAVTQSSGRATLFAQRKLSGAQAQAMRALAHDARYLVRKVMQAKSDAVLAEGVRGAVRAGGCASEAEMDRTLRNAAHRIIEPHLRKCYDLIHRGAEVVDRTDIEVNERREQLQQMVTELEGLVGGDVSWAEMHALLHPLQCSPSGVIEAWRSVAVKLCLMRNNGTNGCADHAKSVVMALWDAMAVLESQADEVDGGGERDVLPPTAVSAVRRAMGLVLLHLNSEFSDSMQQQLLHLAVKLEAYLPPPSEHFRLIENDEEGGASWTDARVPRTTTRWELKEALRNWNAEIAAPSKVKGGLHGQFICCRPLNAQPCATHVWGCLYDSKIDALIKGRLFMPAPHLLVILPWSAKAVWHEPLRLHDEDSSTKKSSDYGEYLECKVREVALRNGCDADDGGDEDEPPAGCAAGSRVTLVELSLVEEILWSAMRHDVPGTPAASYVI